MSDPRQRISNGTIAGAAALLILLFLGFATPASAQDLSNSIAESEAAAAAAAAELDDLKADLAPIAARFDASTDRAAPVTGELRSARSRMARIEAGQRARRIAAAAQLRRIDAENGKAAEKHDDRVTSGIGLGLAALILAALVLTWGWFRASAAVAALTTVTLGQAIGLCVGGGLLALIIGGALMDSAGILAVLGAALAGLGIGLAAAFLLARHSAEIQRGRAKPLLRQERFSIRAMQVLAGALGALCLLAFGTAVFAPAAESSDISAELRARAAGETDDPAALVATEGQIRRLEGRSAGLLAAVRRDRADLRTAKSAVARAQRRMVRAEGQADSFSRRLVSLEAREQREAEAEERKAQKLAETEEREYQEALAAEEEAAAEACNPNYSGCLDPSSYDYDCEGGSGDGPDYTGTVEVLGYDEYDLDRDGDGIGCDD